MYKMALIGNPIKQSASPNIHHSFLKNLNLQGSYELFEITESDIEETIQFLVENNFIGFNVTIPFKETVMSHLDKVDESAKRLQAVNTVKISKAGQLIGYNTDGIGYVQSLQETYPTFFNAVHQKNVLIIGAGGAAKGIYYTLQAYPFNRVDVTNRTIEHAVNMVYSIRNSEAIQLNEVSNYLNRYDLIIQTTSVGMTPHDETQIISLKGIKKGTIVSDIIYKPKWTAFLKEAKANGAQLLFGESMLFYQAREAFHIWTNLKPSIDLSNVTEERG